MASERISVRLDEQCREQFDDLVRESGQSESQVVREAIDLLYQARRKKRTKVVAQPGSVLEVLQRAGLIGCAKGLPHDLSTNRNTWRASVARNVPVLVDAGPLVALLSEEDEHHELCVKTIASLPRPLLSAWATFAEAAWLLQERFHHLESLLGTISEGAVAIAEFDPKRAAAPIQAILRQYRSLRSQLADAILLYLADELGTDRIFTLDRRDFSVYRLKRNRRIRIIPEIG